MMGEVEDYVKGKVDAYEIFYEKSDVMSVSLQGNNPDNVSEGISDGLGVRVVLGKKIGLASTLNLSRFKECCDTAIKIAKLNNPDHHFVKFQEKGKYSEVKENKELASFGFEEIKKYLEDLRSEVKDADKKTKIASANYTRALGECRIKNSEGVDVEWQTAFNSRYCELVQGKNALGFTDEAVVPLVPKKVAEEVKRFLLMRKKKKVGSGMMEVVMHPEAFADLLASSFHFAVDAENVFLKKSVFWDKVGQKVFDEKLSIVDDALLEGGVRSRKCDDEGAPSRKTVLVEHGKLKGFLYDSYYGHLESKGSTGNSMRSVASSPSIGPSNLIVGQGDRSTEEVLSSVKKGLYVKRMMGLHTVDSASGDFSLAVAEGQLLEKGEVKEGVKGTMIAGNLYELLKSVELGKERMYGGDGHYIPHVLTRMRVIGA